MKKIFGFIIILIMGTVLIGCSKSRLDVSYPNNLMVGEIHKLLINSDVEDDKFIFTSSDDLIAKISDKGQITAISVGFTTITVKSEISGKSSNKKFEVIARPIIPTMEFIIEETNYYVGVLYDYKIKFDDESLKNEIVEFSRYNENTIIDEVNKTIKFLRSGEIVVSTNLKNKKYINNRATFNVAHTDEVETYELLFVGNSLTKYTYDIPAMIKIMIEEEDKIVAIDYSSNQFLDQHESRVTKFLTDRKYTHVILQEQSRGLVSDYDRFRNSVLKYNNQIALNGAKTVLYQTWAYDYEDYSEYEAMQSIISKGYIKMAKEIDSMISPVGDVFNEIILKYHHINLYDDINHPSIYGAYLSALVHYGTLTGGYILGVNYQPDEISDADASLLKNVANQHLEIINNNIK